jgi:hypothetical protein
MTSPFVYGQHGTNTPSPISWAGVPPLAGLALYGLESPNNVILSNMQCDTVWSACVFLGSAASTNMDTPSVVSNVVQKCIGFMNVWPNYDGLQLANRTSGVAISNISAFPSCNIPNTQLVAYDNPLNGIQMASQNYAAQYCTPSRGFMPGRYYTTPFTSAGAGTTAIAAATLYAIPVPIACAVTVTQLSTYVNSGGTGVSCEYGIYGDNGSGQPGPLILDAGSVSLPASNAAAPKTVSQQLSPGLVFLVVGCSGTPILQSGSVTGTLLGSLIGLGAQTDTNAVIESTGWSFGALPSTFPGATYAASTTLAPLVFLRP